MYTTHDHVVMMEGPTTKIERFNPQNSLRQIGWLGATGTFYPINHTPDRTEEPGSYSPAYIEIGDD